MLTEKTRPSLTFRSEGHKERFMQTMNEIGKIYDGRFDSEYGSAIYILAANLSTWNKVKEYVTRFGIKIEVILEEIDLSGGESVLVKLAGNLFNGRVHVDPLDFLRLSPGNFEMAMMSLKLRRDGLQIEQLEQSERTHEDDVLPNQRVAHMGIARRNQLVESISCVGPGQRCESILIGLPGCGREVTDCLCGIWKLYGNSFVVYKENDYDTWYTFGTI